MIGAATSEVIPDTVAIRLGVTMQKPTAAEAWDATSRVAQAIIDAAKAAGIKAPDIATTRIDLSQQFDSIRQPDGTTRRVAQGFAASTTFRIRTRDLDTVGGLTQTLIGKGANVFEGVGFSSANPETVQDKLRADAMRDARRQAETIAGAAGVKLGPLLQVERPDRPSPISPVMRTMTAAPAGMPIELGTQTLSAEVEATYAIE